MVAAGTSADGIALTIRATIDNLLEHLTDYLIDSIIEIGVFVEVSVMDQAGAAGIGVPPFSGREQRIRTGGVALVRECHR